VIDNLIAVTMELGAELWVQRERMRIIEQLLAEQGVVTREAIERYESTPEEQERVRSERDAFVQRLYGLLLRDTVKATPGNG
jgi:predicted deacylase